MLTGIIICFKAGPSGHPVKFFSINGKIPKTKLYLLGQIPIEMFQKKPYRELGRIDYHPKERIEESVRGVEFDYYYTGRRRVPGGGVELHVTSVVRDWDENVYIRKARFRGKKSEWEQCITSHIRDHLEDLNAVDMLILAKMTNFKVRPDRYREWKKYTAVAID